MLYFKTYQDRKGGPLENIAQIAILAASAAILILVMFTIPILIDLRRIIGNWKKVSSLLELAVIPFTWSASLIAEVFKKLIEMSEEHKKNSSKPSPKD